MDTKRTAEGVDTVNWVSERNKCNAETMFVKLLKEAERNVEERCLQLRDSGESFPRLTKGEGGMFEVRRSVLWDLAGQPVEQHCWVLFKRTTLHTIEITKGSGEYNGDPDEKFKVIVELNENKKCSMFVDEEELEVWQVLYKALDRLLF